MVIIVSTLKLHFIIFFLHDVVIPDEKWQNQIAVR